MSGDAPDAAASRREMMARLVEEENGALVLLAPSPGFFRARYEEGATVSAGAIIGELEVVGVLHRVVAPRRRAAGSSRRAGRGAPRRRAHDAPAPRPEVGQRGGGCGWRRARRGRRPAFKTPLGGRYYARPSPDAEPFVRVGDVLTGGETVALVEVMKTFNRVQYDPDGLPARAKVVRIAPSDGDDVETGDVLLELEAE